MDPAVGRRWVSAARFLSDLYRSPAARRRRGLARVCGLGGFSRALATPPAFARNRRRPLRSTTATADPGWRSLAASGRGRPNARRRWRDSGAIDRGPESARLLENAAANTTEIIPEHYWSVRPAEGDQPVMRGAVLVRALGPCANTRARVARIISRAPATLRASRPRVAALAPRRRRVHSSSRSPSRSPWPAAA